MKVATILKEVRSKGIEIRLSGENLELSYLQDEVDESVIDLIRENKAAILSYLSQLNAGGQQNAIPKVAEKESYPLSSAQLRFWVLCQIEEINKAYNLPLILKLQGNLELEKLKAAFQQIIERHEVLRTSFNAEKDGTVSQQIYPPGEAILEVKAFSEEGPEEHLKAFLDDPIRIDDRTLFKALLLQGKEEVNYLCINIHHIISDGTSLEVILKELMFLYNSPEEPLAPLEIQYKDYVAWINNKEEIKEEKQFWKERLSGELPLINLATYQSRPAVRTYSGASYIQQIEKDLYKKIASFSSSQRGTVFMALVAALNSLLSRYTSQRDIILGTPVSGRTQAQLQDQVGLYINTLPVRISFSEDVSFQEMFLLQKRALELTYANSNYSFGDIVDDLDLPRDLSRSPIFDILVTHQQKSTEGFELSGGFQDLKCSICTDFVNTVSKYDITFAFLEEGDELSLSIEYNTDLFKEDFIKDLAENYVNLMTHCLANPQQEIREVPFITDEQLERLLTTFNATDYVYNKEETFLTLFAKQVEKQAEKTALVFEGSEISYAELDKRSTELALYLQQYKLKENSIVALCMGRSLEMLIALLGILKAGHSYLPIDPFYPLKRIDYILEDSKAQLVITQKEIRDMLSGELPCFSMDMLKEDRTNSTSLKNNIPPTSTAYVIYTSGSTGKPKGVKITHRNLLNFMHGMQGVFGDPKPGEVWLAVTSISFDISLLELLWTLSRGSKVVLNREMPVPLEETPAMDFSLFYFPTGKSEENEKYKLLLEGASYADQNNYQAVWVPERHFHDFGDQFPSPSIAAAAISTLTKKIKLRSGSVVLPLNDVVRVAEEWSMVDNLSRGRVELSIASGWHPNDFVLAPEVYKERHSIMREQIETLQSFWTGASITRKNGLGKEFEFYLHPQPVQKELPIWITAAGSIETFIYAGSIGANLLTHLLGQSIEDLEEKIKAYRKARKENGFSPEEGRVALMLHTFMGEDEEKVRKLVEQPFKEYLRNSLNLLNPIAQEHGLDIKEDEATLLDMGFLRYYKTGSLFGTPDSCLEVVSQVYQAGVNEIACLIDFGVEKETVLEHLPYLTAFKDLIQRSRIQNEFMLERISKMDGSWAHLLKKHEVSHIQATPSFYEELLLNEEASETLSSLQTILVGGERLPEKLALKLLGKAQEGVYNMYGPTETTIWSTVKKLEGKDVNIGKPIVNTRIYILDQYLQLCPPGVAGEIYIGGEGVAQAYLYRKELSDSRFIQDPFKNAERLYKTGDIGKWLSNGELQYIGRSDSQVKIKGHRIELKEIENIILEQEAIEQCVVTTFEQNEQTLLIAYVKGEGINVDLLKKVLGLRLPTYMLPHTILSLFEFPKTPNGKIDRKKLPLPTAGKTPVRRYIAPSNDLEKELQQLWSNFLKRQELSVEDNFFEIGGNSMKAFQLLTIINETLKTELKVLAFFQYPTIRSLAAYITTNQKQQKDATYFEEEEESLDDIIEYMDQFE